MDGVLNINKPSGCTSHDVVQKVRDVLKMDKKVGHAGTLDPLATGVLPVCVGRATRIVQFLGGEKEYRAVMRLGVTTDTQDSDGRALESKSYAPPDIDILVKTMQKFTGVITQRPPIFSAVKVSGVPSYKLAREGRAEPLETRRVTIYSLELVHYEDPFVSFKVGCSKGVYVRTLCADIGEALGMGAHLTSLVRTRSGLFRLENAITPERLSALADAGAVEKALISMDDALADMPAVAISEADVPRVFHGNQVSCPGFLANLKCDFVRLQDPVGRLLAIARVGAGILKPDVVFK